MSKRTLFRLPYLENDRESLDIEVEVDGSREVVTLHMLAFDHDQVASFLASGRLRELGIRIDDSAVEDALAMPVFRLVIDLAGRHHPVCVLHRSYGRLALRLDDPDAEYLDKCREAIELTLSRLHSKGIEGVVLGIDQYGRPAPSEGVLELCVRVDSAQCAEVKRVVNEVVGETGVAIVSMAHGVRADVVAALMEREPCWAWSPEALRALPRHWPGT